MSRIFFTGAEKNKLGLLTRLKWKIPSRKRKTKMKWYRLEIMGKTEFAIDSQILKINKGGYFRWWIQAPDGSGETIIENCKKQLEFDIRQRSKI